MYAVTLFSGRRPETLYRRFRQILRHRLERLIDRQSEMAGKILHLRVAEHRFQLLLGNRVIGAGAQRGFHLGVEAALLLMATSPARSWYWVFASTALISAGKALDLP